MNIYTIVKSLKQFMSDIHEDYSGIDIEAKILSMSVENTGDDESRQRKKEEIC